MLRRNNAQSTFWNTLVDLDSLPWNDPDYEWNTFKMPYVGCLTMDEYDAVEHVMSHHPFTFFPFGLIFYGDTPDMELALQTGVFASHREYIEALADPVDEDLEALAAILLD